MACSQEHSAHIATAGVGKRAYKIVIWGNVTISTTGEAES